MKIRMPKIFGAALLSIGIAAAIPSMASAHCDTMDGPVIADAKQALETNNINYILKWVLPENEQEIVKDFTLAKKVRSLNPEAQELADQFLFENLVRVHRAGEGAPFTGVKPEGTPIDEAVVAADKSIEAGNLDAFKGLIEEERMPGLKERFEKVLATQDFAVDDVEAGRKYVEAYVQFTHYAEGEEEGHGEPPADAAHGASSAEDNTGSHGANINEQAIDDKHSSAESANSEQAAVEATANSHKDENKQSIASLPVIPWSLAGVFFITTLIFGFRKTLK